jgi:hypothetical protein
MSGPHRPVSSPSRWRRASRSRTQEAWLALDVSDRGRRDAPSIAALGFGRSPHNPWRTVNGATTLGFSPVWFPGHRGTQICRGAHSSFTPRRLCIPNACPIEEGLA